ncbi:energy transducer TonB [Novosphingobium sp. RD2P27]|uniref:Energy transducer TonB n=1 Tax=Novosphingobium kalidii TaxID=3230299 RepID=A0ABV2D4S7_9SPHN
MAYAQRTPDKTRTAVVVAVAGLHCLALYALVTGLNVDFVNDAVTVLQGRNIPIEAAPPPPPKQPPPEQAPATSAAQPASASVMMTVPNRHVRLEPLPTSTLPPLVLPSTLPLEVPIPMASNASDTLVRNAQSARPRNDPGLWVSTDDYPTAALRRGERGTVRFELTVGADGRVADCRVTGSSGFNELDVATCRHVSRRARFEPAVDASGARVRGTYAGSIRWVIPED